MRQPAEAVSAPTEPAPLLEVEDLRKSFPRGGGLLGRRGTAVRAVDGVSFTIRAGETLGIVGESGSGKSTTGRLLLRLLEPDSGRLHFDGRDLLAESRSAFRHRRRDLQMIFQDPYASLDPTKTIGTSVGEPLRIFDKLARRERDNRVRELLGLVGLRPDHLSRYPSEMSGGQRQRVAIARALSVAPRLLVADEAVSALDVSTQSDVLNLMRRLQRELDLTYLFISHNLSVVRHMSDRIAVMYLGRIVEIGPADQVHLEPRHPYTRALLSAIPVPDPLVQRTRPRIVLTGDVPDPAHPPQGCNFVTRCPHAAPVCHEVDPVLEPDGGGYAVACHMSGVTRERQR
ncbi:peptide ABC transporter ATP-binding protein [Pseudonocardia sulfidoxydans NBRC 16205]|uniref:Peptide ABC transporter ATP-binding protein n=1 Tax=Pseudonocardia sulfidoxydans NBRC 16205 TaxID=1223511 RepID=A0A511D8U1_9PSEU|nr:oligopeptide/dipeptide ABC transporter ATP-binding protein [Pseudonocardia sulfidoxydans]GEL21211.1 peptide ABC transporter ATP-binding protein [Pseudonocardia sulfidoxydans NBRC 16205]